MGARQACRLHAREPMTIYAQLLTKSSTGAVSARTPRILQIAQIPQRKWLAKLSSLGWEPVGEVESKSVRLTFRK